MIRGEGLGGSAVAPALIAGGVFGFALEEFGDFVLGFGAGVDDGGFDFFGVPLVNVVLVGNGDDDEAQGDHAEQSGDGEEAVEF